MKIEVTENELLMLLGQKEVELYALRRNETAFITKLNEQEGELLKLKPVEKKKGKK